MGDGEEVGGGGGQRIEMEQFNPDDFNDNMGSSGTIDFKQPEPDSGAGGEQNMPLRHRCDACRIIGNFLYLTKLVLKLIRNEND